MKKSRVEYNKSVEDRTSDDYKKELHCYDLADNIIRTNRSTALSLYAKGVSIGEKLCRRGRVGCFGIGHSDKAMNMRANASFQVARMYQGGLTDLGGVRQSITASHLWYSKSADLFNDYHSMLMLGVYFDRFISSEERERLIKCSVRSECLELDELKLAFNTLVDLGCEEWVHNKFGPERANRHVQGVLFY